MTLPLQDDPSPLLHTRLAGLGVTPRIARQLLAAAVRRDAYPDDAPDIPARVLARVREATEIPRLSVVRRVESPTDGFVKYVFRGKDLPMDKLERAVQLSQERYCGVSAMLAQACPITHEILVEG